MESHLTEVLWFKTSVGGLGWEGVGGGDGQGSSGGGGGGRGLCVLMHPS